MSISAFSACSVWWFGLWLSLTATVTVDGFVLNRPSWISHRDLPTCRKTFSLAMVEDNGETEKTDEILRLIFSKYSDDDSLMSKKTMKKVPIIANWMAEGTLLPEELDEIWSKAPKVDTDKIDVDSFVQLYREIDDLFEDDDSASTADKEFDEDLKAAFGSICDENAVVSREAVLKWEEVQRLIRDGLLKEGEFADIWDKTTGSSGSKLDFDGFVGFNAALDELFDLEDEEDDTKEKGGTEEEATSVKETKTMVSGEDLSPGEIFDALANSQQRVGDAELSRWKELQECLENGDLTKFELDEIFNESAKSGGLDKDGFMAFYGALDVLLEDDEDEDEEDEDESSQDITVMASGEALPPNELFAVLANDQGLVGKDDLSCWKELQDMLKEGDLLQTELDEIFASNAKDGALDEDGFIAFNDAIDALFEEVPDEEEASQDPVDMVSGEGLSPGLLFAALANKQSRVGKVELARWKDLQEMLEDGDLTQSELDNIYSANCEDGNLDGDSFVKFYEAIDDLFEDDDDDGDKSAAVGSKPVGSKGVGTIMVSEEGLSVGELFAALANARGRVGEKELTRWQELQDLLRDRDLLQSELDYYFLKNEKDGFLDKSRFESFYEDIDNLFEEEEDTKIDQPKQTLLKYLDELNAKEDRLPCGLQCTMREHKQVSRIVSALEEEETNQVPRSEGQPELTEEQVAGTWELLYTNSDGVSFHKGLSGLAGVLPGATFGGMKQTLVATRVLTDVEFVERINMKPENLSFDVKVIGDWKLGKHSLFTAFPQTTILISPVRIRYGPIDMGAKAWHSLEFNRYHSFTYLDEDLRVMRGPTARDTVFVFQRC